MSTNPTWGGRRIARPGKKIGRPALTQPTVHKTIRLTQSEWDTLKTISPSPSQAIRKLIQKETTK